MIYRIRPENNKKTYVVLIKVRQLNRQKIKYTHEGYVCNNNYLYELSQLSPDENIVLEIWGKTAIIHDSLCLCFSKEKILTYSQYFKLINV